MNEQLEALNAELLSTMLERDNARVQQRESSRKISSCTDKILYLRGSIAAMQDIAAMQPPLPASSDEELMERSLRVQNEALENGIDPMDLSEEFDELTDMEPKYLDIDKPYDGDVFQGESVKEDRII